MLVPIILAAKVMIEIIRKGENGRLATLVMLGALLVAAHYLLVRVIPVNFLSSATILSYRETALNLRFRSMCHANARIPLMIWDHFSAKWLPLEYLFTFQKGPNFLV